MTKTCSVKKRDERGAGDDGAAEHEIHERAADEGHAAEDGGADAEAPVGVLIEAKNLAGEGHAEGEQQEKDADDPGEFARKLVGAEEKDLAMWMSTMATMKSEPQPCMARRNQPSLTLWSRNWRLFHAWLAVGA